MVKLSGVTVIKGVISSHVREKARAVLCEEMVKIFSDFLNSCNHNNL